jgi:hypothetical protein
MDNYFMWRKHSETQLMIEEGNMNAGHVYSHHDDGGEDDVQCSA